MSEGEEEPAVARARARTYPINSRRLTKDLVGRVAVALDLPTGGSMEETRQMIQGKLVETGREPRNVQVTLTETGGGVVVSLRDEDGTFLEVQPAVVEEEEGRSGGLELEDGEKEPDGTEGGAREGASREAELEAELSRANERNAALEDEVSEMREQLEREREISTKNCGR